MFASNIHCISVSGSSSAFTVQIPQLGASKMFTILKLNFVALKILMFPLLLFGILKIYANNLIRILYVLLGCQRNDNGLFCEAEFS